MKTIIHIGGNKTASTLLQRRLFSKHSNIQYLGEDCENYDVLRNLLDSLVGDDDSYYDEDRTREMFNACLLDAEPNVARVYSNEDIMTSALPSVCAGRLKRLIPDASVVMVIRNQLTTWPSWYANHGAYLKQVPRRYWRCHVDIGEWLEYCFSFPKKTPVEAMNYERFYEMFASLYGTENIHVFMYEELVSNPQGYYGRWAELLGMPVGDILERVASHKERPRNSARRMRFDRWASRWSLFSRGAAFHSSVGRTFPPLLRWLESGPPADISLPCDWGAKICDYYRDANSRLAARTGLDLGHAGYPVR